MVSDWKEQQIEGRHTLVVEGRLLVNGKAMRLSRERSEKRGAAGAWLPKHQKHLAWQDDAIDAFQNVDAGFGNMSNLVQDMLKARREKGSDRLLVVGLLGVAVDRDIVESNAGWVMFHAWKVSTTRRGRADEVGVLDVPWLPRDGKALGIELLELLLDAQRVLHVADLGHGDGDGHVDGRACGCGAGEVAFTVADRQKVVRSTTARSERASSRVDE